MADAKNKRFYVGAAVLAIGGFVGKAIGALYRIPLMNILGAEGMGVYQLIFPLYSLLLTFSSSAVPVAISRLVAEHTARGETRAARRVFRVSLVLFFAIGVLASGVLAALSGLIARAQGNGAARLGYLAIAPAVAVVSLISAFRGYFQGLQQMVPTALSQIVEQLVKLGLGLYLTVRLMPDIQRAVGGAVFAVTVSEVVALLLLAALYLVRRRRAPLAGEAPKTLDTAKRVLKITLPVTVGALILPFSQIVDSLLVINLIGRYADNATELYGLMTGAVFSLNSLPVAIAFSIAVSSVPYLAKSRAAGGADTAKKLSVSVTLTMLVAVPAAVLIFFLSDSIASILYPRLDAGQLALLSGLFRAASVGVVFLSFTQTLTSCLQGLGKIYVPVVNLAVGVACKIGLSFALLPIEKLNIFGAVISTNVCYLVAGILNLVYIIRSSSYQFRWLASFFMPLFLSFAAVAVIFFGMQIFRAVLGEFTSFVLAFLLGAAVYAGTVLLFYREGRERGTHSRRSGCKKG